VDVIKQQRGGKKILFVRVCVLFASPKQVIFSGNLEIMAGYYQNFGMSCSSLEEVKNSLLKEISEGVVQSNDLDIKEVEFDKLDPKIKGRSLNPELSEVWYRSGKAYFEQDF